MQNEFQVISGRMILSDPCYSHPSVKKAWCQDVVENVKNGTWVGFVDRTNTGGWGFRNASLISINKEELERNPNLKNALSGLCQGVENLDFDGGVDSGQFGHFDLHHYRNDLAINGWDKAFDNGYAKKEGDEWYRVCCHVTLESPERFGEIPFGVVSESGYGDGSYDTYGVKNDEGEFVGFITIFIGSEEDEEE